MHMQPDQFPSLDYKNLLSDISDSEQELSVIWEERLKEEQTKTAPLEEVCAALREDLDIQQKKRMESFETKMKPIIIKEGPSKRLTTKLLLQNFIMKYML